MAIAPVRQGSPEWLAARRSLITATDIAVLMGDSPWKSEADLADEKRGLAPDQEPTLRMRTGLAMEPLIAAEYGRTTGRRLRRFHGLVVHPGIGWAAASPDYRVVGQKRPPRDQVDRQPQPVRRRTAGRRRGPGHVAAGRHRLPAGRRRRSRR
jgi:putative phage-type endonuclease